MVNSMPESAILLLFLYFYFTLILAIVHPHIHTESERQLTSRPASCRTVLKVGSISGRPRRSGCTSGSPSVGRRGSSDVAGYAVPARGASVYTGL